MGPVLVVDCEREMRIDHGRELNARMSKTVISPLWLRFCSQRSLPHGAMLISLAAIMDSEHQYERQGQGFAHCLVGCQDVSDDLTLEHFSSLSSHLVLKQWSSDR